MRSVLAVALFCSFVSAQFVPPGYRLDDARIPPDSPQLVIQSADGIVTFDQFRVRLESAPGTSRTLLELPAQANGWFLAEVAPGLLALGAGIDQQIWTIPTDPMASPRLVGSVRSGRDGARFDARTLLITRVADGGGAEVVLFDLETGRTVPVIRHPGVPGPVAVSDRGVWIGERGATALPLMFFGRRAVVRAAATSTPLAPADRELETTPVAPATQLAVDADDDLWVMVRPVGDVWEHDFVVVNGQLEALGRRRLFSYPVAASAAATDLSVFDRGRAAQLDAFQPASDATILLVESLADRRGAWRTATPRPARTVAPSTVPAGPFTIEVEAAAPNGMAFVALGTTPPTGPREIRVGGFDAPLWWDFALLGSTVDLLPVTLDGDGRGGVTLVNPGFGQALGLTTGTIFVDAAGEVLAGTPAVVVELR